MQYAETPIEDGKDCPDGKHHCPNGETCCKLNEGRLGCCAYPDAVCCKDGRGCCTHGMTCCYRSCCPHPNAVCCDDMLTCCPHGYQCDLEHNQCIGSHFLPMFMGLPEVKNMEKVQLCA